MKNLLFIFLLLACSPLHSEEQCGATWSLGRVEQTSNPKEVYLDDPSYVPLAKVHLMDSLRWNHSQLFLARGIEDSNLTVIYGWIQESNSRPGKIMVIDSISIWKLLSKKKASSWQELQNRTLALCEEEQ